MPAARPPQPQPILPSFGLALAIVLFITGVIGMLTRRAVVAAYDQELVKLRRAEEA